MSSDGVMPVGVLASMLAAAYGLPGLCVRRLHGGTATVNYAGVAGGCRVFVKQYPPGTDLGRECAAVALSRYAGRAGVPVPRVLPACDGELIHVAGGWAVSVWEWVDGVWVGARGMTVGQMRAAGGVTGWLHRVLADHPAATPHRQASAAWCRLDQCGDEIARLLGTLIRIPERDEFLRWAHEVLRWRLGLLPRIGVLLAELPPLYSQVVHGDLASPNVLWRGEAVAGLIDFRPPRLRPVCWELARLGCDPRTVLRSDGWLGGLAGLVDGYRGEFPDVPAEDLCGLVRAWVCYAATSTYPFTELITGNPAGVDDLRRYARDRHHALVRVLECMAATDEVLRAATAGRGG